MKRFGLMLGCALGLALQAAERPAIPPQLTLREAIKLALDRSPALRRTEARVEQAEARRDQTRAVSLPQLSLTGFQSYQTQNLRALGLDSPLLPTKVGPFPAVDLRLNVAQDLLNMASWQRRQAASTRALSAREQQRNARESVVLAVVNGYLQALRAQAAKRTLSEQAELARRLYGLTRDRHEQGVSSTLELNRARQQVNTLEQAELEAGNNLTAAKLQLTHLLHAVVTADFELADNDTGSATVPARAEALRMALEGRNDYRAAQTDLRAAEMQLRAIRSTRLPVFQAQFDVGQSGRTPLENINTYRLRGVLSMPLFTGGRIEAESREAQAQIREAQAVVDEIRSQVETDVLTALAAVESVAAQLRTSQENVKLAREELELAQARMTSGVADNTEVVNAQDRLARAEDTRIRTEFNLQISRANLFRAAGLAEKVYRR